MSVRTRSNSSGVRLIVAGLVLASSFALSGCTLLDKDAQDLAACNKISDILTAAGQDGFGSDQASGKTSNSSISSMDFDQMASALESEAIPLASMSFGETLTKWVHGLRKIHSQSIFNIAGGWLSGSTRFVEVSAHCIKVGMKDS